MNAMASEPNFKLLRRAPSPERKTGLFKYFASISRDEHHSRIREEDEKERDREEDWEDQELIREGERLAHKRKLARERQKKCRERRRISVSLMLIQDTILLTPAQKTSIRKRDKSSNEATEEGEPSSDDSKSENESDVVEISKNAAELTRPKRAIMAKEKKDKKGRGRKRVHRDEERLTVNWKHPLVFSLIQEVQQKLEHSNPSMQWSPVAIVKECQATSWQIFKDLTPQVLGRYIDRSRKPVAWSSKVMDDVARNGHTPGMHSTRKSILDNHPSTKLAILNQLRSLRQVGTSVSVAIARAVVLANIRRDVPDLMASFRCSDTWV